MSIVTKIKSYILESDTKILIVNNKINITNYIDIGHFDSNKIIIKLIDKDLIINGNNLVISKLLSSELLVTGNLTSIEFR